MAYAVAHAAGRVTKVGDLVALETPKTDNYALVQVSGAHAGLTAVVEGSLDGGAYSPLSITSLETGETLPGVFRLRSGQCGLFRLAVPGIKHLRVVVTELSLPESPEGSDPEMARVAIETSAQQGTFFCDPLAGRGPVTITKDTPAEGVRAEGVRAEEKHEKSSKK